MSKACKFHLGTPFPGHNFTHRRRYGRLSPPQARLVFRKLAKYASQLAAMGLCNHPVACQTTTCGLEVPLGFDRSAETPIQMTTCKSMQGSQMALKYKQTFTVKGKFQFPIDMLRYDGCFPFDESDGGKIERAMDAGCDPWEVKLMRYVETKNNLRTIDRWRSFCAEVVTESVETTKMP